MANPVTYSFLSTVATITGPNGVVILGQDAGVAEEGITAERTEEQVTTQAGADGTPIHMLHANRLGRITVRLLKTSSTNSLLMGMYNLDYATPTAYGQNTIVVAWLAQGDVITGRFCGFARAPTITYAKEGPMIEWLWTCGYLDYVLGAGAGVV